MKFLYCFLISFLLSLHFCRAQINLKIKAGAARSNLRVVDGHWIEHAVTTWYGGVATNFRINKRLFLQPELLYSERGCDLRMWDPTGDRTLIRRYGYISMPILVGWHPFKKISLLLGAEPGYMVWDHAKDQVYEHTYKDVDRRFNVDIDLGLAYQPLRRWTVEARGLAGLIGLYEEWGQTRYTVSKTGEYVGYHFIVQFGVSYDLDL